MEFPLNAIGAKKKDLEEFESKTAKVRYDLKFDKDGAELFEFGRMEVLYSRSRGRYNGDTNGLSVQEVGEGILHHALAEDPQAFDSLSLFMKQSEPKKITMNAGGFSTGRRKATEFLKVENFD
jgi:hypothetical protein